MLAIVLVLLLAADSFEAAKIDCERVDRLEKFEKCCYLNGTTAINEVNVTFAGLEMTDVIALNFERNKKIEFLPVNVYKKFPSLEAYLAAGAEVKEISAVNFRGLANLKVVDLSYNRIQVIPDDCFQGLMKLHRINFEFNHIRTMNGIAFANLPQLMIVQLKNNECIGKNFEIERGSNKFIRKISRNCGLNDVARKQISCSASVVCHKIGCCELEYYTYIDTPDYTFVADSSYATVHTLMIVHQPYIDFLPVSLHESFPLLNVYYVVNTAVKKLSKKNFEKMDKLKELHLNGNQIEVIQIDTFEDLVNLEFLSINNEGLTLETMTNAVKGLTVWDNTLPTQLHQRGRYGEVDFVNEIQFVEIACERFTSVNQFEHCIMDDKTVINATNFVVAELRDEEVKGIEFSQNKAIQYLPYKVYMQFPNLKGYKADNCSIKAISHENFEKLSKLRYIDLSDNEIQQISTNTFEGLESLWKVDLKGNQIKSINGRTFDHLPLLTWVDLTSNKCIDDRLVPFGEYDYRDCEKERKLFNYNIFDSDEYDDDDRDVFGITTDEGKLFRITDDECSGARQKLHYSMKNFTRKIIQNCAFTETGERDFEKVFDIKCGVGKGGIGFVINGNETERGQWPFMAALISEPTNQFFCGGNVITASHVLTAAHCIQYKHAPQPLKPSEIAILLGRYNISLSRVEVGSEIRGVKSIKVHPDWNPNITNYGGDIAVLEMDRAVQFSELIQPVCVTVEQELSQHEAGYVVGWGKSESYAQHESVPKEVLISSVTDGFCFKKAFKLGSMFDRGMYCAGGDGAGPCTGDSGGGFFVNYHNLWTLRGIVSSGTTNTVGSCDVNGYTLFTSILDYTSWIGDVVKENDTSPVLSNGGEAVDENNEHTSNGPNAKLVSRSNSNDDFSPEPIAANATRKKYYRRDEYH